MPEHEVFHPGEIAVQERSGERAIAVRRTSLIRDRLDDGMGAFVAHQGAVAVGAMDRNGALWASLWCGRPGFLKADANGKRVAVLSALDHPIADDPVRNAIVAGAPMGMLVIDFLNRRRLRINGRLERADGSGLDLRIEEVFGNCSKYIQRRQRIDGNPYQAAQTTHSGDDVLDAERRHFILRTDTAFVASLHPERGLDVSHRGGEPGFVQITGPRELRIPDYPGNSMFQTLGNLEVDSRAGIAFIDFERRRILSLTGRAVTVFGAEDPRQSTGGTGRLWSFTVDRWVEYPLPAMMTWVLLERSPSNPRP